jgi:predicted  nucleic acid-binding Zn-ribbon protein
MKSINEVTSSIRDIRTPREANLHAAPKAGNSSAYLDLFMLNKEKEKLTKEEANLEKRKTQIHKRLQEIEKQVKRCEELLANRDEPKAKKAKEPAVTTKEGWRKMPISY